MSDEIKFQDSGEVKEFVTPRPCLYVAVYWNENSEQPWGVCSIDKQQLITSMSNWYGIDRSRPIRIYTITP